MNIVDTPWADRVLVISSPSPEDWFTARELAIASTFRLEKRREEWLLSRAAAKRLAVQLGIAVDPREVQVERPTLRIEDVATPWYVSLSHSAPYAAAAISRRPIGVDIQVVRHLDESAAHLFLSDEETEALRRCSLPHRILHFWSAKEAAWKQRSSEFATLKQVPLRLQRTTSSSLLFDGAETIASGEFVLAVTT